MRPVQAAFDDVLRENPEFTFWESCAELLKSGDVKAEAMQDPAAHVRLHQIFQRAKQRANTGRVNHHM